MRTESGPLEFLILVHFLTSLHNVERKQVILVYLTLPFSELLQGRVFLMDFCYLSPQLIYVVDSQSKESEAVIQAIKVGVYGLKFSSPM